MQAITSQIEQQDKTEKQYKDRCVTKVPIKLSIQICRLYTFMNTFSLGIQCAQYKSCTGKFLFPSCSLVSWKYQPFCCQTNLNMSMDIETRNAETGPLLQTSITFILRAESKDCDKT